MVKIRIISIHAPREGGDSVKCRSSASSSNNFNPRPPRGGRRYRLFDGSGYQYISIHAPREGGDYEAAEVLAKVTISIHAPREGGDKKD